MSYLDERFNYSYTNRGLTTLVKDVWNGAVQKEDLGFQFFFASGLLFANDLSTGGFANGDNIILTADSSKLYINVTPSLEDISYIDFQIDPSPAVGHSEARLHWNDDDKTLEIGTEISGTTIQIGQEQVVRCVNKTPDDILNGKIVYVSGAQGNRPTIELASASSPLYSNAIGWTTHNIIQNRVGYVTDFGLVRDLNTADVSEGADLWLDLSTGEFAESRPPAPYCSVRLGVVLKSHATEGMVLAKVNRVSRISYAPDVSARGSQNQEDILYWNSNGYWESREQIPVGTPTSSSAPGIPGQITRDSSYLYVCTAVDTWGRTLLDYSF